MSTFEESWLTGPHSTQFYTRLYKATSPKAVLVFIHGFNDHIGRYEHVHSVWAARGITVFTYDQRGFGRTATDVQHKSKDSIYGKTSWKDQFTDIEWALKHAKSEFKDLPIYLMGHSMGGGLVLGFATRSTPPPDPSTVSLLSGIIATSPLIQQTVPASKIVRWIGGKVALVAPYLIIPAPVKAEDLSHDPAVGAAHDNDPFVKHVGSLRELSDMFNGGDHLLQTDYQRWPKALPLLLVHGTDDKVASPKASEAFFAKLDATDKTLSLYPGGFHELQNEPDGVKEKFIEECISWVEAHLSKNTPTVSKL